MTLASRACRISLLFALLSGCAIFERLTSAPEFSLSGARVALMPFAGPGNWWYGENPTANQLHAEVESLLREGAAQLCRSDRILRELAEHLEDSEPPWVQYGSQLGADYVVVSHLASWDLDRPGAIGFTLGRAVMDVQVYDVEARRVAFRKRIECCVGSDPDSTDIYTDREAARRALLREVLLAWAAMFVTKPASP